MVLVFPLVSFSSVFQIVNNYIRKCISSIFHLTCNVKTLETYLIRVGEVGGTRDGGCDVSVASWWLCWPWRPAWLPSNKTLLNVTSLHKGQSEMRERNKIINKFMSSHQEWAEACLESEKIWVSWNVFPFLSKSLHYRNPYYYRVSK